MFRSGGASQPILSLRRRWDAVGTLAVVANPPTASRKRCSRSVLTIGPAMRARDSPARSD